MQTQKINIAIDGFSSCGKSTIAKQLAKKLNYTYVDSGAMYRAVALFAIRHGWISENEINEEALRGEIGNIKISFKTNPKGEQETYINNENVEKEIRSLDVANGASRVSTLAFVRQELVRQQQEMGKQKGVVMDGRDIGTVVFPNAELKIFVTASPEVRARRRFDELKQKNHQNISLEEVLSNIKERDHRDITRKQSPLKKANDAFELDNSLLTREEQLAWVLAKANEIIERKKSEKHH